MVNLTKKEMKTIIEMEDTTLIKTGTAIHREKIQLIDMIQQPVEEESTA